MWKRVALGALFGLAAVSTANASADTQTLSFDVEITSESYWDECANGGAGEWIDLSGSLHVVQHTTTTPHGQFVVANQVSAQGTIGVGETTGTVYVASYEQHEGHLFDVPGQDTVTGDFRFIDPGTGDALFVHVTLHVTIDANGNVTAEVVNVSEDCR